MDLIPRTFIYTAVGEELESFERRVNNGDAAILSPPKKKLKTTSTELSHCTQTVCPPITWALDVRRTNFPVEFQGLAWKYFHDTQGPQLMTLICLMPSLRV